LAKGELQGVLLSTSNFQGANSQGANFQGTNFQGTNFQGTNFQGTNFQGPTSKDQLPRSQLPRSQLPRNQLDLASPLQSVWEHLTGPRRNPSTCASDCSNLAASSFASCSFSTPGARLRRHFPTSYSVAAHQRAQTTRKPMMGAVRATDPPNERSPFENSKRRGFACAFSDDAIY
jgi:Pentapeptide repeats (8 copies)